MTTSIIDLIKEIDDKIAECKQIQADLKKKLNK